MRCRTAEMGGHIDRCNHKACGKLHLSYNSCRNRHCTKCQGHMREQWIAAREADLLNCRYFHVVFTLPEELNVLAVHKPALLYNVLFQTAWAVIRDFGKNPRLLGAGTGMIAVLHTWGQGLSLHPHLHCIVPAGGLTKNKKWKATKSKGKYLFPVKAMGKVFKARFIAALSKEEQLNPTLREKLFAKPWVVYAKQPFYGPKQVIEYLGRYTHKIAISNHRIKSLDNDQVTFSYKDYRKGGKKGLMKLGQKEFIRRFALHILPKGFTRIRHYGILSSSSKITCKKIIEAQIGAITVENKSSLPTLHRRCPACKKGFLETVLVFGKRGPPKDWQEKLMKD